EIHRIRFQMRADTYLLFLTMILGSSQVVSSLPKLMQLLRHILKGSHKPQGHPAWCCATTRDSNISPLLTCQVVRPQFRSRTEPKPRIEQNVEIGSPCVFHIISS